MRRLILSTVVLLAVPQLAAADVGTGSDAGRRPAEAEAGTAASETRVLEFPPVLDLRLWDRQLPAGRERSIDPLLLGTDGVDRDRAAGRESANKGLSFGVEVKRRRPAFESTRPDEDEAPGLQDEIEGLIDHSTLGVRGIYRF